VRVLLTGITGFVGSHIVEHLQANTDWEIEGLATFRHMGDSTRTDSFKPGVRIHNCDVSAPISQRLIDRIGPIDLIINAASESHVDRSIVDPRHFIENNVGIAISMLEYARIVQPKVFLQVSTDEVYGPAPDPVFFMEWNQLIPSNPYSASKAAQEVIAISYWRTYGIPLVITNTMNMFGERQDTEKFIPMVVKKIMQGETIAIHGTPDHIGSRSYLHARNHADALLFLLERQPAMFGQGATLPDRWNVAGDREIDNLELATSIADIVGREWRWEFDNFHASRPGHDLRYALDGSKIRNAGWKAPLGLAESLERTVRWTLEHEEWLR
jgi:dTDP-glucose 4,6-dehydratase